MTLLLCVPLLLQAILMSVDEMYFHRRRGLPRWERVGHPIDTFSVFLCYGVALLWPPRGPAIAVYAVLSAISCLLVTKDEFVHAGRCLPTEQWLHSLLFILHPIVLGAAALLWLWGHTTLLTIQAALTLGFGGYQFLYWNIPWKQQTRTW